MPRHNASTRARNGRRTPDHAPREDTGMMNTEQMANRLVERGLASRLILTVWRGDYRPDETR
jgi:hypothetical protein